LLPLSLKQYWPPRGPVQIRPERHEQSLEPGEELGGASKPRAAGPPWGPVQIFFEPLIEPSLHTKSSPAQCATPPLLPEHG